MNIFFTLCFLNVHVESILGMDNPQDGFEQEMRRVEELQKIRPMYTQQRQQIPFDKSYLNCALLSLDHFDVRKYKIEQNSDEANRWNEKEFQANKEVEQLDEKLDKSVDNYVFFAASPQKPVTLWNNDPVSVLQGNFLAYIRCPDELYGMSKTSTELNSGAVIDGEPQTARRCGLAAALSYLCMIDRDIHGMNNNSITKLPEYLQDAGYLHERKGLLLRALLHCDKLIFRWNAAEPEIGGKTYMTAAIAAGFDGLITINTDYDERNNVWQTCAAMLRYLPAPYSVDPSTNARCFLEQFGTHWYFCKPKNGVVFPPISQALSTFCSSQQRYCHVASMVHKFEGYC